MTASIDLASLRERVRDAVSMIQVATWDHVALKIERNGRMGKGCCPFHAETTPSFVAGGKLPDRYHCFGCGESGDIFDYMQKRRGVDHLTAVKMLADWAGIYVGEVRYERPKAPVCAPEKRLGASGDAFEKPSLPPLSRLSREGCETLAAARGLDAEAVWLAARHFKRVVYSPWPLYRSQYDGQWRPRDAGTYPSWAAVDETFNVAEFRRLDNGLYTRADGTSLKCWSTAGKSWPLGARQIKDCRRVLLVEGGPDMLAAYHFLRRWHSVKRPLLQEVVVVCMLGAGNRIREDALECFKGCRVRIMVDGDLPKDDPEAAKRKLPGLEAAARWTAQLSEAGAAVVSWYVGDVFDGEHVKQWRKGERSAADIGVRLAGYSLPDGSKAKDLNDLARCAPAVLESEDVRRAFTVWDF